MVPRRAKKAVVRMLERTSRSVDLNTSSNKRKGTVRFLLHVLEQRLRKTKDRKQSNSKLRIIASDQKYNAFRYLQKGPKAQAMSKRLSCGLFHNENQINCSFFLLTSLSFPRRLTNSTFKFCSKKSSVGLVNINTKEK